MSEAALISISEFAIKFGLDAAIAWLSAHKPGATIDDAIAALQLAKTKTAQDYLNEAKAALSPSAALAPPASPS